MTSSGFKPEIELYLPIGMYGINMVALSMIYLEAKVITFTSLIIIIIRGNGISTLRKPIKDSYAKPRDSLAAFGDPPL